MLTNGISSRSTTGASLSVLSSRERLVSDGGKKSSQIKVITTQRVMREAADKRGLCKS